jgi:hypothetical protein
VVSAAVAVCSYTYTVCFYGVCTCSICMYSVYKHTAPTFSDKQQQLTSSLFNKMTAPGVFRPRSYQSPSFFAMKSTLFRLALANTALVATNLTLLNGWFVISSITKIFPGSFRDQGRYLTWKADNQIRHSIGPMHAYDVSALLSGVKFAYYRTHDGKYAASV